MKRKCVAPLELICIVCGQTTRIPEEQYRGVCPQCGNRMRILICNRCGNRWKARRAGVLPDTCSACKSPYWCRARIKERLI